MPLKGKQNDLRTQEAVFSLNVPVTEVTEKSQETKSVSAKTSVSETAFLLLFITCFVEFFDVFSPKVFFKRRTKYLVLCQGSALPSCFVFKK